MHEETLSEFRRKSRSVNAGGLFIGGGAPVSVQTMTNIPIDDVGANTTMIARLKSLGAELVRLAVRNEDSVKAFREIRRAVDIPICADIHFDYRLAIKSIEAGADKIRINPGNIGSESRVKEVVRAARERGVPIRIGVNGGSIDRNRFSGPTPENLVESALEHVRILEDAGFYDIVVSIKASDLREMIEANRIFSGKTEYPVHVGLTEAGYGQACLVSSSIAIGHLLLQGIGDTIRVSMTGDPADEILAGIEILNSLGLRKAPVRIISCPTCGRTDPSLDLLMLAKRIDREFNERFGPILRERGQTLKVAVMGCEVNGPGEASDADLGLAGGRNGSVVVFSSGRKIKKIDVEEAVEYLLCMAEEYIKA